LAGLLLLPGLAPAPLNSAGRRAETGQAAQDEQTLVRDKALEREMAGGESHAYRIALEAGQFLLVIVDQRGIDVVLTLFGPDGKRIMVMDSPNGRWGPERITTIAETAGSYRIVARSPQKDVPAGRYEIKIAELRAATDTDRALAEARRLFNEAMNIGRQGKLNEAIQLMEQSLAITEQALGPEHLSVAATLNNLAILYLNQGDYAKATSLQARVFAIREKALGPDHASTVASLHNLALTYKNQGDYAKAEPLFQRAVTAFEKVDGPDYFNLATALDNLGTVCFQMGDSAKAESLLERALAIREKAGSPAELVVAATLNNLAVLHEGKGDYAKAVALHQRALALKEKLQGAASPDVAITLNNLAFIYYRQREYAKARPLYQRALAIFEKALGPEHPDVANSLGALAAFYRARNDPQQAIAFLARGHAIQERNISRNIIAGSERRKLAYLALFSRQTADTISLHLQSAPDDLRAAELALVTLLARKGRALDAGLDAIAGLRRHASAQDQALLTRLSSARSQLAALTFRGPGQAGPASYRSQLSQLEDEEEKLQTEISARSAEFQLRTQPVTLASVQSAIPRGAALVEFALYSPFNVKTNSRDPLRYAAYALAAEGPPRWVDLGEAAAIDRSIAALRQALRDPKRTDVKQRARAVDELVMSPVRALLGKTRRALLSPDGSLNLIPFAALVDERNQYLITRYSFSYLTSGRDLLRLRIARENRNDPLIVADPAFGEIEEAPAAADRDVGLADLSQLRLRRLPGTASEAQALKALLPRATVLTEERATEAALKQVSSPSILHIATHGFFLKDAEAAPENSRDIGLPGEGALTGVAPDRVENPLLRSGLVLAGANNRRSGEEDGVLTALEVAGLDLWGTKLVVLSACNTGVGEVKNGEGVYGLRRALALAGAESQVMSLWSVSDRGTRDLMVSYYRALRRGEGRGEALRQVQLHMLGSKDRQHPYYWASFIQSGEWKSLEGKETIRQ
jgi:CHAT domain-containing protein/Tfp pilus assembly protein PilF